MNKSNANKEMNKENGNDPFNKIVLISDRNRWFVITLILSLIVSFLLYQNIQLRNIKSTTDMAWVKLYNDGTWDITVNESQKKPEFFVNTINSLLAKFVKSLYQISPHTIENDYAVAQLFMTPDLSENFIDKGGFNALKKMGEAIECGEKCENTIITDLIYDHYDQLSSSLDNSQIYKSNIHFREDYYLGGQVLGRKKYILSIEWRILSKEGLLTKYPNYRDTKLGFIKYLEANPIGLEILKYEKYEAPNENN